MQNSLLLKWSVVGFHLLGDKNPTLDVIEEAISKDQYKSSLEVGLLIWSPMQPPSNCMAISSQNNLATNQQHSGNHNNISREICMGDFTNNEVKNHYKLW